MNVWVLMENTQYTPAFACEHGLSLYLETGEGNILFDTGASPAFAENARLLGVDLAGVDLAVLSHGHYDHGGGLKRFLELNRHGPVYLSSHAFGQYFNASGAYIGLDPSLKGHPRLIPVEDSLDLGPWASVLSCAGQPSPFPLDSAGLTQLTHGVRRPDAFLHEQYLLLRQGGRRIVISGCSHRGVLNILTWLRPDVFIGGFHFMKQPLGPQGNPLLDQAAQVMLSTPTQYYTGHCTGAAQYAYLKEKMGDRLHALSAGLTFSL